MAKQPEAPESKTTEKAKPLTAADAAELVKREVPELDKEGKLTGKTKQAAIDAAEVFAFRDHGDHVIVVTRDGRKLRGDK